MKIFLAALLVLASSATLAEAQPSGSATIGATYASFRDGGTAATPRQDVSGTAGVEHLFRDERGRVFYGLDGGTYEGAGDWSYWLHSVGATYLFGGDGDRDRRLFVNASAVLRKNGSAWAAADYTGLGGGLNAEFHPGSHMTVRTGYRLDRRSFIDTSALTHVEHGAFSSLLVNFESRTTVIGELQFGAKSYTGPSLLDPAVATLTSPMAGGQSSRSHGMGPGVRMTQPLSPSQRQNGAAGLASGVVRVAQSIAERTGVYAQASVRTTFGEVPPGLVTTPAGFSDDGVYDDAFASNATTIGFGLTSERSGGASVQGSGSWSERRYTSTTAVDAAWFDLPDSPLRCDRVWRAGAVWSQPVLSARTGAMVLTVDTGYRFVRSRSNDAFYTYTSHSVGLSLSIRY